ncbi:TPA: helix-turn-helix domain-containing protein [Streptococcus pyogenes]
MDKDMKNTELMKKAKVSKSTFYKIKNGDNVTTDVLLRICNVLECDISEIVECVNDSSEEI